MHPEQRALLNGIIAEPERDDLRLIYCDWLEEHEAMVTPPDCKTCGGTGRRQYPNDQGGAVEMACPVCGHKRVSNGLAALSDFVRAQCEFKSRDWSDSDRAELLRVVKHQDNWFKFNRRKLNDKWKPLVAELSMTAISPVESVFLIDRGFVSGVQCRMEEWLKCGPEFCETNPVQRVSITSIRPAASPMNRNGFGEYSWRFVFEPRLMWDLPDIPTPGRDPTEWGMKIFRTETDAIEYAGKWCLFWAQVTADLKSGLSFDQIYREIPEG